MTDIRSLERTLLDNLPWNKARIIFCSPISPALYVMRTVNLSMLATAFSGHAKEELFCRSRINCPPVIPEARKRWGLELYLSVRYNVNADSHSRDANVNSHLHFVKYFFLKFGIEEGAEDQWQRNHLR
jgi:hypothetical protein